MKTNIGHYVGVDLADKSVLVAKGWFEEYKCREDKKPPAIFIANDVGSSSNQLLDYID